MKRSCMLILFLLIALPTLPQEASQPLPPIIDMHLHAFPANWSEGNAPFNRATGKPSTATTGDQLLPKTLEALRRYNIVKAVTSGPLDVVEQWRAADPDRIIGSPSFPSTTTKKEDWPDIDGLRTGYQSGRLGALGEILGQYVGLSPSDPAFEPYLALAEKMDIPVGIHMGLGPPGTPYRNSPKFRITLGKPALLEPILLRHPKLRVYIMHAGWPYLEDTLAVMSMYPQVHTDISIINWIRPREEFHNYLRAMVRAGYGKRILFGSDQMYWPEAIGMAVEGVESAEFLTEEQKRDIFYNNAVRFLRLEQE